MEGSGRGYTSICLKGLRKITKTCQDSRLRAEIWTRERPPPPEYEAGVLTTAKFIRAKNKLHVLYKLEWPHSILSHSV
jgi:hypothetical protein